MRRPILFAAALALALVVVYPALATPPPWANARAKPTTTTAVGQTTTTRKPPKTTTTVGATTTTLPATTTTGAMPTTTVTMGTCQAPLTISTGGVYTLGCYESTSSATPAVTIATTQPVTLDRMTIKHRGMGVYAQATVNTNVTITNSQFIGTNPGSAIEARAVYLLQPASFVFEHNRLQDGHGVLINGNNVSANPLRIRYNDYIDIGRWNANTLVGAVHFDQVLASAGAEIAWNRVSNHYGRSYSEDVIGIHESNGGGTSGTRIEVHHNLIDGSYPYTGDGAGFTGGGIDLGDGAAGGGSWQVSHDNTVLRVTNNGLMIPGGSNLEHFNNRVVVSGIADNGSRVSSTFGSGLNLWDNPGYTGTPSVASEHHNSTNARRWTGSAWEYQHIGITACDPVGACVNNVTGTFDTANWTTNTNGTALGLTVDADWLAEVNDALSDWEAARVAAGVTVGPLP